MRLATWNIKHGWRRDTRRPDPAALAESCAAFGADVLALQEVDRGTGRVGGADLLAEVAAATGLHPVDGAVLDHDGGTYGNALLLARPPDAVDVLRLPVEPGREPRGALRAALGGRTFATCHLDTDAQRSRPQLALVVAWLDGVPGPVVLAGDLNHGEPGVPSGWTVLTGAGIDHVLVRGIDGSVLPDAERPVVSDHRPVLVELG